MSSFVPFILSICAFLCAVMALKEALALKKETGKHLKKMEKFGKK